MVVVAPAASYYGQRAAAAAAAAVNDDGNPVFPLLSAGQCALGTDAASKSQGAIQFWHSQPLPAAGDGSSDKKQSLSMMDYGGGSGGSTGSGGTTCHDCGNQAKKDCQHHRCRTCCKSRGFDCSTHVRSTWIPACRRRERHQLGFAGGSSPPTSGPPASQTFAATAVSKKPRLLSSQTTTTTSTSNGATTPRSFDTSSSHQDASFRDVLPRQVRAPAVFRCVRVSPMEDGDDEFTYQAAVTINGHMFRGFLYDQGADDCRGGLGNEEASHAAAVRSISDLHLGSASASAVPTDLYILGGLGYGNTMN